VCAKRDEQQATESKNILGPSESGISIHPAQHAVFGRSEGRVEFTNPGRYLLPFLQVVLCDPTGEWPQYLRRRASATKGEPAGLLKLVEDIPVDAKLLKMGPQASHTLAEL
jgi:hypothetical protein